MTEPPRSLRLHICVIHHQMSREQSNISTFTDKTLAKKKKTSSVYKQKSYTDTLVLNSKLKHVSLPEQRKVMM